MATVPKYFGDTLKKSYPPFDLPEKKYSGVRGDFAAPKVGLEFFPWRSSKRNRSVV